MKKISITTTKQKKYNPNYPKKQNKIQNQNKYNTIFNQSKCIKNEKHLVSGHQKMMLTLMRAINLLTKLKSSCMRP